jgi:hypothetical protein
MGRPKADIDWDRVGELFEADCTVEGTAAVIGVHRDVLYRRCKTDLKIELTTFKQQKKAKGDEMLRVVQMKTAMAGDKTMLIWLGKQRLGQVDKSEQTQTIRKVEVQWVDPTNDGDEITDSVH